MSTMPAKHLQARRKEHIAYLAHHHLGEWVVYRDENVGSIYTAVDRAVKNLGPGYYHEAFARNTYRKGASRTSFGDVYVRVLKR